MKHRARKLGIESLEARRVLAAIGDQVMLETPDVVEPMPEEMPAELDMPPVEDVDWIRPIPQEAHHFVARLRPVADPVVDPPATDAPPTDSANPAEGETDPGRPFPLPHFGGIARFFLNRDESLMRFRLRIPFVEGVTSADIHLGRPADGGPSVATLFQLQDGTINGLFLRGELTSDDIEANNELDFDGTLASLVKRMRDGDAYVEVHSQSHPDGVLRGKIHPLSWRPWHNPVNRMDVNGDRDVTPLDLLNVVRDMNEKGARVADVPMEENAPMSPPFVDVTGDNVISPQDALALVQFLTQYGEDLLHQVGVPPEAVSDTLDELQQALQFDGDGPQTVAEIEDRIQGILADRGVDVDAILDQVSETWERDYRERFSEWIGQAEEMAQQIADHLGGPTRDWPSLFDEAFNGLADHPLFDGIPGDGIPGLPHFL